MSRDDATLLDILKAARLVTEFKGKIAKKAFLRDIKTQSAILHRLLMIGERFLPTVEMTHPAGTTLASSFRGSEATEESCTS